MYGLWKLLPAAALAVTPPAPIYFVAYPMVQQIVCDHVSGTGFEADHHFISVRHVTENSGCKADGDALATKTEEGLDFATEPSVHKGLKINCDGFKIGEQYWALGYAFGMPIQRAIPLIGTGEIADNGMAILFGYPTVIPGMSGGVILNSRAEAVGTVNMYSPILPYSFSVELKSTSLCRK